MAERSDTMGASGKFVLRIEPGLHEALRAAAEEAGLSLNEYCARKLAVPGEVSGSAVEVVTRASSLLGEGLAGVVVFGSWARGEATDSSDVDVLVVVDASVELERGLYREWDRSPLEWDGRRVEAHFVKLPGAEERITGLWAEVAVDGVVLYDRGLAVSGRLGEFRGRIATGEVVRKRSHGQPYWVEAA